MSGLTVRAFLDQLAENKKAVASILVFLLIPVFFIALNSGPNGDGAGYFTRDPASTTKQTPFLGILSNLSVILWGMAAAIAFTSSLQMRSRLEMQRVAQFFLYLSILSLILMLDDLLQIHETLAPDYLGVNEKLVLITYAIYLAGVLFIHRKDIRETQFSILFISLFFFVASVVAEKNDVPWPYLFEDGLKFLGIGFWLLYFASTAVKKMK